MTDVTFSDKMAQAEPASHPAVQTPAVQALAANVLKQVMEEWRALDPDDLAHEYKSFFADVLRASAHCAVDFVGNPRAGLQGFAIILQSIRAARRMDETMHLHGRGSGDRGMKAGDDHKPGGIVRNANQTSRVVHENKQPASANPAAKAPSTAPGMKPGGV